MNSKNKKDIAELIKEGAEKITDDNIRFVIDNADEVKEKVSNDARLVIFFNDINPLISLVEDYWEGEYREVPHVTIAAIVFTLLYVLEPLDRIPDFIPMIGYAYDYDIMLKCFGMIEPELDKYKKWKLHYY